MYHFMAHLKLSVINFFQFCCSQTRNLPRITVLVPMSNQSCAKPWAWILGDDYEPDPRDFMDDEDDDWVEDNSNDRDEL